MKIIKDIQTYFLLLFGLITVFVSSAVIFDWFGIRAKEGDFVPFVVYANMTCGYLYLIAFFCNIRKKFQTSFYLLMLSALILIGTFFFLNEHIATGGLYEVKTLKAMSFRTTITFILTGISWFLIRKK
jgi:undecaprenyl pyrophosphate phosphatase UppP